MGSEPRAFGWPVCCCIGCRTSTPDMRVAWAKEYGRQLVRDTVHWFLQKFNVQFYTTMRAFNAARLMCPVTVQTLGVTPASVQQCRMFQFLDNDDVFNNLAEEPPLYLATAQGTSLEGGLTEIADEKVKWLWDHASTTLVTSSEEGSFGPALFCSSGACILAAKFCVW